MSEPMQMNLPVVWPDIEELQVYRANQFLLQLEQNAAGQPIGMLLSIGEATPPVLLGSPEEQQATAMALGAVPAKGVVRVSMDITHVQQLLGLLQQFLGTTGSGGPTE